MKTFILIALVMCSFAANSLLNKAAVHVGGMGPVGFACVRLIAGALTLSLILLWRDKALRPPRPDYFMIGFFSLYMIASSYGYLRLDAGVGSLILFAGVQITMFLGARVIGERATVVQWSGLAISIMGLAYLVWPSAKLTLPLGAALIMSAGALGWGMYSLLGARSQDPIRTTAWNFIYTVPLFALICPPLLTDEPFSKMGVVYAVLSGAIASGLGYSVWYYLLPQIGALKAALVQRVVPVMIFAGGILFFGEILTLKAVIACVLILSGMALGVRRA